MTKLKDDMISACNPLTEDLELKCPSFGDVATVVIDIMSCYRVLGVITR